MSISDKETSYLSSASWGKTNPTQEAKQFLVALVAMQHQSKKPLNIVDAGAGLGRNSIYLAQNGFNVTAVEYDEGAIRPLKENIDQNGQTDNIQVINANILDYLRAQEDHSIDALLDSGMSHYLNPEQKKDYFSLLKEKLSPDGLLSITHFSKEDKSGYGLEEDELKQFLDGMSEWEDIHYDTWVDSISQTNHSAYKGLLSMPDGHSKESRQMYLHIRQLAIEGKLKNLDQARKALNSLNQSKTNESKEV